MHITAVSGYLDVTYQTQTTTAALMRVYVWITSGICLQHSFGLEGGAQQTLDVARFTANLIILLL